MKEQFKIGDKLVCKETHQSRLLNFYKNKMYEICEIDDGIVGIIGGEDMDASTNEAKSLISTYYFEEGSNENSFWFEYVWDYFYKPQEIRNLKIKKLNVMSFFNK